MITMINHYQPIRVLGQGGFGETILAKDTQHDRIVVLKRFNPNILNNRSTALKLFREEASRLAELGDHDRIPTFVENFELKDDYYIVQQYIPGQNLEEVLKLQGNFLTGRVEEILRQVLEILQFIHEKGVIHRDIKSENIILGEDDLIYLVDFGSAKIVTETALLQTSTKIGSAEYIAFEQAGGKPIPASDIYSLGVTCLHLLTNVKPFTMMSFEVGKWYWRDYLPPDAQVAPTFAKVLDKMVEYFPRDRYTSAEEILKALDKLYEQNSNELIPESKDITKKYKPLYKPLWNRMILPTGAVVVVLLVQLAIVRDPLLLVIIWGAFLVLGVGFNFPLAMMLNVLFGTKKPPLFKTLFSKKETPPSKQDKSFGIIDILLSFL